MTKSAQIRTLRLPFAMADRHLRLEEILAADSSRSWVESQSLLAAFALTRPEKRFARRLLMRKRNLWLFRCNQRQFCGDFIIVDMSASHPSLRSAWVIELKSGARLTIGRPGIQMQGAKAAVEALSETTNIISRSTPPTTVRGDYERVLDWLVAP